MRGTSLALAAYLAYARRHGTPPPSWHMAERPPGTVIWAHAPDRGRADALTALARHLVSQRPDLRMLLTTPDGATPARPATGTDDRAVIGETLPPDSVGAAEAFLAHWRPDLCLWSGGDFAPALLSQAAKTGVPLCLVDAEAGLLDRSPVRWLRDLPRAVLAEFTAIHARDEAAGRKVQRMGAGARLLDVTGALQEEALSLPVNDSDREEMAHILRGRPVWLAALIQPDELDTVLAAHREAIRIAHRSLLIVVPDDPAQSPAMAERIAEEGWRHIAWSEGALPDESTQVILADTTGEMGLWYRLAPISFMGSSLVSGAFGRDPDTPAAHGSAILYGPNVGRYLQRYARYAEVGAARIVRDTETLAAGVQALLPPDRAAAMAQAAWEVATRGAEVSDRIVDMVFDALDRPRADET